MFFFFFCISHHFFAHIKINHKLEWIKALHSFFFFFFCFSFFKYETTNKKTSRYFPQLRIFILKFDDFGVLLLCAILLRFFFVCLFVAFFFSCVSIFLIYGFVDCFSILMLFAIHYLTHIINCIYAWPRQVHNFSL